jgi:hypothetical protein
MIAALFDIVNAASSLARDVTRCALLHCIADPALTEKDCEGVKRSAAGSRAAHRVCVCTSCKAPDPLRPSRERKAFFVSGLMCFLPLEMGPARSMSNADPTQTGINLNAHIGDVCTPICLQGLAGRAASI